MNNHEIDYKIHGEEMQCVEIELDPNESVISEPGSFMMMEGIQMQTMFVDGNEKGLMGKNIFRRKKTSYPPLAHEPFRVPVLSSIYINHFISIFFTYF